MKKKLDWYSDPLINHVQYRDAGSKLQHKIYNEMDQMHRLPHLSNQKPIEFFKHKLGRQNYTWVGYNRNWVWESDIGWRVYVNNEQGISFEIKSDLNFEEILLAWKDFLERIGLYVIMALQ